MPFNAHKLFQQAGGYPCLRAKLDLLPQEAEKLKGARRKIRDALRAEMRLAAGKLESDRFYEGRFLAIAKAADLPPTRDLEPRFRTQGSWAYGTLNRPAQLGQQIDLDDGMYVPMSFLEGHHPTVASEALFEIVEDVLVRLCQREGWRLDEKRHSKCIRVLLDSSSHVDITIYAIPDEKMEELAKAAAINFGEYFGRQFPINDRLAGLSRAQLRLASDQIYVANRETGWEQSDPLQLEDWFKGAVSRHSHHADLARISRYAKAWRDHKWMESNISSLLLMVCAVDALDAAREPPARGRDDAGLLLVAESLPERFRETLYNPLPGLSHLPLNDRWSTVERGQYELMARGLCQGLRQALHSETYASAVVRQIRDQLGERVPNDPSLVAAITGPAQVRSTAAVSVASPLVGVSDSG